MGGGVRKSELPTYLISRCLACGPMTPGITNNRNLTDTDPFQMSLVPFESPFRELSNGAKLIQNGAISMKLRPFEISRHYSSASLNTRNSSYLPTTPLHTF